jgi:hypothetical protein
MSTLCRSASGDLAVPLAIQTDPGTYTSWKIQDELGLWLGEWFIDVTVGFPWVNRVLGLKNPSLSQIRALLRQAILETPLVVSLVDLNLSLNPKTRALAYAFRAFLQNGAQVTGGTGVPFIVNGGAPAQNFGNVPVGPAGPAPCMNASAPCGCTEGEQGPPGPAGPAGTNGGLTPSYIAGPTTFSAVAGFFYVIDLTGPVVMNVQTLPVASSASSGTGFILVGATPSSGASLTVNAPAGVAFAPPPPNNDTTLSSLVFNTAEDAGASLNIDNYNVPGVYATS